MANKHFTTNMVKREREQHIRNERKRREHERQALRNLQRSFDLRAGRSVA